VFLIRIKVEAAFKQADTQESIEIGLTAACCLLELVFQSFSSGFLVVEQFL